MLGCIVDGSANSAGELIDQLQKASPERRREMLDAARAAAGLKTATDIEIAQRMEEAGRQSVARRDHRLVLTPHGFMDVDDQQLEAKRTARNR